MPDLPDSLQCYLVERDAAGRLSGRMAECRLADLPPGDVLVRVAFSSLNYKDALAATGHPGITRVFPHVPGVDAAGTVVQSETDAFAAGQPVLVTGFDMGAGRWGGWAEYCPRAARVGAAAARRLTLRESMLLGTAGLTAAMCVEALRNHGITPDRGPIAVTGASGGVGGCAVAILAGLGYRVAAISGKEEVQPYLKMLGAAEILGREAADDKSAKPLLPHRWAGAIDAVGGNALSTLLRATAHGGCVAACGMAAGTDLPLTVYPFILRAVTLAGIDAAWSPLAARRTAWQRLAGPWKPACLEAMARQVPLAEVQPWIDRMLAGRITGRVALSVD